jgi:hypothetical protein
MTAAFQPLITDHLVLLWLSREEWTPRKELGPPDMVDGLIASGYARVLFNGRHGDAGGDGITLTEFGWQEVARIQERLR